MKNDQQKKNIGMIGAVVFVGALIAFALLRPATPADRIPFSEAVAKVKSNEIEKVVVQGDDLNLFEEADADDTQEPDFQSRKNSEINVAEELREAGVVQGSYVLDVQEEDTSGAIWGNLLFTFGPIILFIGVLFFFMKQIGRAHV